MIITAVSYFLIVAILYIIQDRIVFQPTTLGKDYVFQFDQPFYELPIDDEQAAISSLYFPAASDTMKGLVLYFHGNADNLQRWGEYAIDFTQHDYGVLAIDYPGYGKSEGVPDEQALYRSAELALEWAQQFSPLEHIIIYGRSLGSGPASWLAARHEVKQLILETPFTSIPELFWKRGSKILVPFTPRTELPVAKHIQSVAYPISILQGTNDWVVPYDVAIRLQAFLKPTDHFFTIDGGGHKNLRTFPEYHEILADLLR